MKASKYCFEILLENWNVFTVSDDCYKISISNKVEAIKNLTFVLQVFPERFLNFG